MVELLAPAGSLESLRAAVNAGADAVYIGGRRFGARAYADNPGEDELLSGIDYCHIHGRKLYMTVNTLLKEQELEELLYEYLAPYYKRGLDGVIVQDFGVMQFLADYFPALPVHASTQMTVTGVDGARLLQEHGVTRVVTARELSLQEIRRIIAETGMEVETFIHGAMCYSYSGQCLLSSMIGGRSGNRGRCAQPCRLPYQLKEANGTERCGQKYLLSMKDMCTLELLPELVNAGIASLKIEGRMKRPEYTAGVVSIYRSYLDRCLESGIGTDNTKARGEATGMQRELFPVEEEDRRILMDLYNRGGFTDGYYHRHNGTEMMAMERPNHFGTAAARVKVRKKGEIQVTALEPLYQKDVLELHDASVEFTAGFDAKPGDTIAIPKTVGSSKLKNGSTFYRTKCEHLLESLKKQYIDQNCKEKINGELRISVGSPAILKLDCGDVTVTVRSDHVAEAAQSQPTGEAAIEKQLRKTGNTPFTFDTLRVFINGQVFFPVRELNELRRRGLEELAQAILELTVRELPDAQAVQIPQTDPERSKQQERYLTEGLTVSVMTARQLDAVLQAGSRNLKTVYLDLALAGADTYRVDEQKLGGLLAKVQERGYRCCLNFPPVFREKDRMVLEQLNAHQLLEAFDGFVLHTVDELAFARQIGKGRIRLIADDTFYAYNTRAAGFLCKNGIHCLTFPAELNFRELKLLAGAKPSDVDYELTVYGRQALMHSAQCLVKNTGGCTARSEVLYLKDRKNAEFVAINRCVSCCNTIYNSVPLELADCEQEIARLNPQSLRLSFTTESEPEVAAVLKKYEHAFFGGKLDEVYHEKTKDAKKRSSDAVWGQTRGHFRRGVE